MRLQNREEILLLLLNYGGDLYIKDNKEQTPMSILQSLDSSLYHKVVQEHLCTSKDAVLCNYTIDPWLSECVCLNVMCMSASACSHYTEK